MLMLKVSSEAEVLKKIADRKKNGKVAHFESNFYGFSSKDNRIFILDDQNGVFFLELCGLTSQYIYYFFFDKSEFVSVEFLLPESAFYKCEYIVSTVVSKEVVAHLNSLGFVQYALLKKMSKINTSFDFKIAPNIEACGLADLDCLRNIFDSKFDSISDRLPSNSRIIEALSKKNIIKISENGVLLGFYWADNKRFLSELRYIFVDELVRGRSFGEVLFQHYLNYSSPDRKSQLWVLDGNIPALKLYGKYGFKFEQLRDYIFKVEK